MDAVNRKLGGLNHTKYLTVDVHSFSAAVFQQRAQCSSLSGGEELFSSSVRNATALVKSYEADWDSWKS